VEEYSLYPPFEVKFSLNMSQEEEKVENIEQYSVDDLVDKKERIDLKLAAVDKDSSTFGLLKDKMVIVEKEIQKRRKKRNENDITEGRPIRSMKTLPALVNQINVQSGSVNPKKMR